MLPSLAPGKIIVIDKGQVNLNVYNIVLEVRDDADEFLTKVAQFLKQGA